MKISYRKYELPFVYPFTTSKGTKTHQPSLVIELDHFGIKGYGEAPAINYYNVTVEDMIADIEAKRIFLEKFSFQDPERWWHYLHHLFPNNPFLICALDMAGWDIFGKIKRKPLWQLWDLDPATAPQTDYTIGIAGHEKMLEKMQENPRPIYKLKVGFEGDVERVQFLREHTDAVFRVDANEGWTLDEAKEKISRLADLNVELIEQPLNKENWEGMKALMQSSPLPLFADEACVKEADVLKCAGHFHGVNIKLTKCSGITPARRMIDKSREHGLRVMLGCMNESVIGTAALAQLSPLVDLLDADGPQLLAEPNGSGLNLENDRFVFTETAGLGITPIS